MSDLLVIQCLLVCRQRLDQELNSNNILLERSEKNAHEKEVKIENEFKKEEGNNNKESIRLKDENERDKEVKIRENNNIEDQSNKETKDQAPSKTGNSKNEKEMSTKEGNKNQPTRNKGKLWHSRYGHLSMQNLKKLLRKNMVNGFDYDSSTLLDLCEPCIEGKHHHFKFPTEGGKRAKEKLELGTTSPVTTGFTQ